MSPASHDTLNNLDVIELWNGAKDAATGYRRNRHFPLPLIERRVTVKGTFFRLLVIRSARDIGWTMWTGIWDVHPIHWTPFLLILPFCCEMLRFFVSRDKHKMSFQLPNRIGARPEITHRLLLPGKRSTGTGNTNDLLRSENVLETDSSD